MTVVGHQLITLTSSFVQHDGRNAARRAGLSAAAEKGKEEYVYRAILYTMYISKRSGMDHTVLPANTCLLFLRKRSPDGVTPN